MYSFTSSIFTESFCAVTYHLLVCSGFLLKVGAKVISIWGILLGGTFVCALTHKPRLSIAHKTAAIFVFICEAAAEVAKTVWLIHQLTG